MGTYVFYNSLLISKFIAVSICIYAIEMLILKESACATGLYYLSKSIPWIRELPFAQWFKKITLIRTVDFLNTWINEWTEELFSVRYWFYWYVRQKKSDIFCSFFIAQIKLLSVIVSEDALNLHQCYLGLEVSLGE